MPVPKTPPLPKNPIAFGGAIKATKQADGSLKITGDGILFTNADEPDLCSDFFEPDTYFGEDIDGKSFPLYFHHGIQLKTKDPATGEVKMIGPGRRKIGTGTIKIGEKGLLCEAVIPESEEYFEDIKQIIDEGRAFYSSGAVSHLVTRKAILDESEEFVKAWKITSWPLGEVSITHTPAEPRNAVTKAVEDVKTWRPDHAIKSLESIIPDETKYKNPDNSDVAGNAKSSALTQYGCYEWYYGTDDQLRYDDWDPGQTMVVTCYRTLRYRLDNAVENIAGDENMTPEEQAAAVTLCFDEARDFTIALLKAITSVLPIQDGDADDPQNAKSIKALLEKAQKSFAKHVPEDVQPPAIKTAKETPGVSFAEQGKQALGALQAYVQRAEAVRSLRATKSGGQLSAEAIKTLEEMQALAESALSGGSDHRKGRPAPAPPAPPTDDPKPNPDPGAGDDAVKSFSLSPDKIEEFKALGIITD